MNNPGSSASYQGYAPSYQSQYSAGKINAPQTYSQPTSATNTSQASSYKPIVNAVASSDKASSYLFKSYDPPKSAQPTYQPTSASYKPNTSASNPKTTSQSQGSNGYTAQGGYTPSYSKDLGTKNPLNSYKPNLGTVPQSQTRPQPEIQSAGGTDYSRPSDKYGKALTQPLYQQIERQLNPAHTAQPSVNTQMQYNVKHPHQQAGTDAPPNTDTYTSPLFRPEERSQTNARNDKPLIQIEKLPEEKLQVYSYKSNLGPNDPEQSATDTYTSFNPTPSNINRGGYQESSAIQDPYRVHETSGSVQSHNRESPDFNPKEVGRPQARDNKDHMIFQQNNATKQQGQPQTTWDNPMFQPGITVTGPSDGGAHHIAAREGTKSSVNIDYHLPEWYSKDRDTNLYENRYMIDSICYLNKKVVSHSPPRGTVGSFRETQTLRASSPQRLHDNPVNISQGLGSPKSTKKWDKTIPRVIMFVYKYNAADMEDDLDDDRLTTPRRDYQPPMHNSPFYLEKHQKVYQGGKNSMRSSQVNDGHAMTTPDDDGVFDIEKYQRETLKNKNKNWESDMTMYEEDEGVRQSVRVTELRATRRGVQKS